MYELQKIIDDVRNWNIVDIQFITFDKEKEEVEWTLELRKLYLVTLLTH